jgi:hypothetical protein
VRRIFGPKRDEVKSEWRKLNFEKLNDLYSSHSIVRGDQIGKEIVGDVW